MGTRLRLPTMTRRRVRLLISTLVALAMLPIVLLVGSLPASADTSQFRGVNWAVLGDNFQENQLVIEGLSSSDSYNTVRAKTEAVLDGFESHLGANTIRLPINTHTVGTTWWNSYRGVIDAATDRGFKVILAYWEDGAASGGRITNMSAFNTMWSTVTSQYGSNSLVYFEPMNEPVGYSASEWADIAADWLDYHYSAPHGRVLIGGSGYSQDLRPLCNDSRFNGTLFSFHHYAFFYGDNTEAGWRDHFETRLGNCASRAIVTEYGATMDTGLNYNDPNSSNNEVRHIRAVAAEMREHNMGGTYWPGIGGKLHAIGYDGYSMFALQGSGTNLSLTVRNDSGLERIRYGWGDDEGSSGGGGGGIEIVNRNSGKCLDVLDGSSSNGASIIQWDCWGGANQQWVLQDAGSGYHRIVSQVSGRCLDVNGASTANGAKAIQWQCNGGTNQQWEIRTVGGHVEIVARHSGKCLDVLDSSTANGAEVIQWDCVGGANQQWSL